MSRQSSTVHRLIQLLFLLEIPLISGKPILFLGNVQGSMDISLPIRLEIDHVSCSFIVLLRALSHAEYVRISIDLFLLVLSYWS